MSWGNNRQRVTGMHTHPSLRYIMNDKHCADLKLLDVQRMTQIKPKLSSIQGPGYIGGRIF